MTDKKLLLDKLQTLSEIERLQSGLPHLHGWKWYPWAREFFESTNKMNLLCAANQISKSSSAIRKCIDWATDTSKWPSLWKTQPRQFWYLYPSGKVATVEWRTKWVPEFMPRGSFKNHPKYGWTERYSSNKYIESVEFNTGVIVFFKTYEQDVHNLQSGTVSAMFCFTAGQLVTLERGQVPIEKVQVGDRALTREGTYELVTKTYSRESSVISRALTNGVVLTGTPDHKVWTVGRGYVELQHLTPQDVLVTPEPRGEICKNTMGYVTTTAKSTKTEDCAITGLFKQLTASVRPLISTWISGEMPMVSFLKDTWFTIRTVIRRTTSFLTWSLSVKLSILAGTRKKSGPLGYWRTCVSFSASLALRCLRLVLPSLAPASTVRSSVGSVDTLSLRSVLIATTRLLGFRKDHLVSVLGPVLEHTYNERVHCVNVANAHNFCVEGISVSNCDEELPIDLLDELIARLTATDGFFHMVFTATRGQEFWKEAIEDIGMPHERFKDAWKRCISLYDCLVYDDGTPSPWTVERIERRIGQCRNEKEVLKRVMGRFVKDDDLKYGGFNRAINVKKPLDPSIPKDWHLYSGVDLGSGGKQGHPSAIAIIAVRPDYKKGRVFKLWRGDGVDTTAGDVYRHYLTMKKDLPFITMQQYDSAAKDFYNIADRSGDTFYPAEKGEVGVETLNSLFAHEMLDIDEGIEDSGKLVYELSSISKGTNKRHAKDDLADALRYACSKVPWDWAGLRPVAKQTAKAKEKTELDLRRELVMGGFHKPLNEVEEEFGEWNSMLED